MSNADLRASYLEQGYVLRPGVFAFDEIAWVRDEARVVALRRGQIGRLRGDEPWAFEAPEGTIYGAHLGETAFHKIAAHPRLLNVARELLGADVYIHQTRLVPRLAEADVLWRRDFQVWSQVDRMATADALTAVVLLGDSTAQLPALHVAPASHLDGDAELAGGGKVVPVAAPLGSVLFAHANLAYAFNQIGDRRSPALFLVSYSAVANRTASTRQALYAAQDEERVIAEADDSLWPTAWCAAG